MDHVSKEDMLTLALIKSKIDLAQANAQKAMLEVTIFRNEYKESLENIKNKYSLSERDTLSEDGVITRGVVAPKTPSLDPVVVEKGVK